MSSSSDHIIVIGAGVTGLTSAVFLAEAGHDVTVVAAHVPGDSSIEYTSPWYVFNTSGLTFVRSAREITLTSNRAGAHWHTHATPADPRACDWDAQTYQYWTDLLEKESKDPKLPKAGLKVGYLRRDWRVFLLTM